MGRNPLQHIGYIALPAHSGKGGFDHAAVHASSGHVYVAHTANDALEMSSILPASGTSSQCQGWPASPEFWSATNRN